MIAPDQMTLNIAPGEIIQPDATIELRTDQPVDPKSAQDAVQLTGPCGRVSANVTVKEDGHLLLILPADPAPGAYQLVISELLTAKHERLIDRMVVPFSVIPVKATVPAELRIEHAVRLVIGEFSVDRLAPGEPAQGNVIEVFKAVDRKGGRAEELAFDERGERVDITEILEGVERRRSERFGRVHETLWSRIARAGDDEPIAIVVWPRIELPAAPYEKPTDRRLEEMPDEEREVLAVVERAREELRGVLQRFNIDLKEDQGSDRRSVPFLRATATAGQIRELAQNDAIGVVFFDDQTEILDLGNSIAIARSDRAHTLGFDGTGIRVAVWESGPSDTTNLSFAGRFSTTPGASDHARLTSAIVKNIEPRKPHGHAPDCDLYSANSGSVDALRWAIEDEHCTVVSQSFHRDSEPEEATLQSDDILKDWLILRWPYPTIVQAAGNYWDGDPDDITPPESEYVNHKGFNSLAVGNHNDSAGAMSGSSVFRNPSSSHGDRELPEIAANDTSVSAVGESESGTSFASPATAGVAALLQDVDSVLCSWPEGCRAILMAAAARNISGQTWWQDVVTRTDALDGAGAVDAEAGVLIAQQRRWKNAPATRRGWDVGTLSSAVVGRDGLATFRYFVTVPRFIFSAKVKVALAWDSAVTSIFGIPLSSRLTVDLDLIVRDSRGHHVASAVSWDNSYEIVEFAGSWGETYEIVIRRWSGTDSVWFGIAWTVSGVSIVLPVEEFVELEETVLHL